MPQDWDGRDGVLERERKEWWWTDGEEMKRTRRSVGVGRGAVIVSQLGEVQSRCDGAVSPRGAHLHSLPDTRGRPQSNIRATEHDLASSAGKEGRRRELV